MKVQTAFRIEETLLDDLKEKAKAENRSLNNYVESILMKEVGLEPNELTKKAIHEARTEKLDLIGDLEAYKKALLDNV